MMGKYGLLMYKDTANLGDDIQSYAVYRHLPKVDYLIDREAISSFCPEKKESVKVVMNGWFNHNKDEFLISPYIDPLFISMHFTANDLILKPGYTFLTGYAKEIMEKYKIGCRDKNTNELLKSLGYKNTYFSSCLTTTIDPIGEKKDEGYIVAVDMKPQIVDYLKNITGKKVIETTHWLFIKDGTPYEEKIKKINAYDKSTDEKRKNFVKEHSELSIEERMKIVEKQLKLYQNASLVVTDRIHVGLPCLGLNTNVLLIFYDYNADRIETFKEFLTNCTEDEFYQMTKEQLLSIKNSNHYQKYRENLEKTVEEFIKEKSKVDLLLPDIDVFKNIILKRENYKKELYIEKIQALENENKKMKKDFDYYQKVKNSKSFKILNKIYQKKAQKNK